MGIILCDRHLPFQQILATGVGTPLGSEGKKSSSVCQVKGVDSIFPPFDQFCSLFWLVHESPKSCKGISQTECKYIDDSIWEAQPEDTGRTPFLAFARSRFFWAIMVAHAGQNYGYETLMTMLPTYMDRILGVDLKSNGVLSSLPYLAMWVMAIVFSIVADRLIRRRLSITTTRKIMNSLGQYGPAVALIVVGYLQHSLVLTSAVFVLGLGLNGAIYSGFKINHLDLSPRFAGLLISITNCVANLVGLTAPMVAGHVIHLVPSIENWRIVFHIAGGVYIFSATFYNLCASGKPQW
ncbi:putative inorganic phosphate cotransporter [Drosophila guanche]|uniref:Blast:Putative inorganic phosphate cotransporter n=1 Tax=Drosophila guanche TaxID=7266 RepID=A0A3B0K6V8_DROGU|nr:putative inorganic phosphate cotransporter [Drosophila guanche]SPP89855.1 blast:Putative inorganic phosphate cotransporter [Drosophila guanche]